MSVGSRDIALAVVIVSPGHDRAICFECKAVTAACGNRYAAYDRKGHVALTVVIVSPCHDRTIGFETKGMAPATGYFRVRAGKILANDLSSPGDDLSGLGRLGTGHRKK
jgi:hypothetical protein